MKGEVYGSKKYKVILYTEIYLKKSISIITVCFNAAHLLAKTIESVIEQTYNNVEYIVVDGNSTDSTNEIIAKYRNNIHIYVSEPDSGIFDAMNKGISMAKGDLIIFLNAGDYYISPFVIEYFISKLNTELAEVFFGRFIWEAPQTTDIVLSDNSQVNYSWDLKELNFPHPATIYTKNAFEKVGLFDLSFPLQADYEWNVRALVKMKIAFQYINIITVRFRADGISNDPKHANAISDEKLGISKRYYQPEWLYKSVKELLQKRSALSQYRLKLLKRRFPSQLNKVN